MTFTWTAPDPLNNTTKTRSIYVSELQVAVNVKRAEIGLPPISFIDQSVGKKFRLSAIEELKTTLNDLAILYGYPTGVQDSALLGRPYVEITKKYGKYVCHYPILNDLRIVLNLLSVRVILYMDYVLNYAHPTEDRNLANLNILVNPTLKSLAKSQFSWNARCRVACDFDYIYRGYPSGVGDSFIYKENIITGINLAVVNIPNFFVRDICVDDTYVYLSGIDTLTGLIIYVKRILKSNLTGLTNLEIISIPNFIFGSSPSIICDKNYLYVACGRNTVGFPDDVIFKISKTGGYSEYSYGPYYGGSSLSLQAITIDDTYLYVNYWEQVGAIEYRKILKINKNTMILSTHWNAGTHGDGYTSLAVGNNYVYELSRASLWGLGGIGLFTCYDKNGGILQQSNYVSGYYLNDNYMDNRMACKDEYAVSLI